MKIRADKYIAAAAAAAMLCTSMPVLAVETTETPVVYEETASQPRQITESVSGKTYTLDEDQTLTIVNSSDEALIVENCKFEISGSTGETDGLDGKLFVQGNVEFRNCSFTSDKLEGEDTQAAAAIQIISGTVTFENASFEDTESQVALLCVNSEADVEVKQSSLESSGSSSSVIRTLGGTLEFLETDVNVKDCDTEEGAIALSAAYRMQPAEKDEEETGSDEQTGTQEDSTETEAATEDEEEVSADDTDEDEDEELELTNVPALSLEDSSLTIQNVPSAGILGEGTSGDSIVRLKKASLTISESKVAAERISLESEDSTISISENETGLILFAMDLNTTTLNLEDMESISLELTSDSAINQSQVSIGQSKGDLDVLLGKDVLLEIRDGSSGSLGRVQMEEGADIQSQDSDLSYELINDPTDTEEEKTGEDQTEDSGDQKDETAGDVNDPNADTKEITDSKPVEQPAPETAVTKVTIEFLSLSDGKAIQNAVSEDVDDFPSVQEFVYSYPKGINGYNYVKYEYAVSEDGQDVTISLYYEEKEKYSVAVNYVVEGSTVPIHFANVLTGLKEGETYDVSRFNAIDISGYTYVKTVGSLTGTASGADQVINIYCYYTKNDGEMKNDTSLSPEKGDNVHTSTQTNSSLFIGILAGALILICIIAGVLIHSRKKKK